MAVIARVEGEDMGLTRSLRAGLLGLRADAARLGI